VAREGKWDAGLYDEKHSFVWKMAAGLLELLAAESGERILDVGCGTGHLTAQIATSGAQTTGIDNSPEMIRQAREQYPQLQFLVMDARRIVVEGTFDAVFSNAALHWIREPEQVLRGIARSLRPGGRFVAEFGGQGNTAAWLSAASRAWTLVGLPEPAPHPWYYPSLGEYAALLERHGFELIYGALFDRPTPLEDGERGLRNWMEMFGGVLREQVPVEKWESLMEEAEREARGALYREGQWVLDYRRLRVVAKRA
jgi:trans-aconitate methyltransferase